MPLIASVIEELRQIVGRESVISSANDLRIFERDASIEGAIPDAVVLAASTEQVSAVIKVAAKHRIPVVPRGAGTGLSGGAVTIRGGIALQVTRMRRILEIDPVAQTALVLLRRPAIKDSARSFYDYLHSEAAAERFRQRGFELLDPF